MDLGRAQQTAADGNSAILWPLFVFLFSLLTEMSMNLWKNERSA